MIYYISAIFSPVTCTECTGTGSVKSTAMRLLPMSIVMLTMEGGALSGVKREGRKGTVKEPMAATVAPSVPLKA